MPRVASIWLPTLATDRLRRADRRAGRSPAPPEPAPERPGRAIPDFPGEKPGSSCSTSRSSSREAGGWRPGAHWAGDSQEARARKAAVRARLEAEIGALPTHQRPPMRELGRRSEAAPIPFRAMPPDEAGALASPDLSRPDPGGAGAGSAGPRQGEEHRKAGRRVRYDLEGAFWHTGRTLAGNVARGSRARPTPPPPPPMPPEPPMVTAAREGQKMVIAAACPAARALGLNPGTALAMARAMVPGLDLRDADPAGDAAELAALAIHAARFWTPLAAVDGADGIRLDLTGAAHLHGGEARMARRIVRFLARCGLEARVAIADTGAAAHALVRHGRHDVTICPAGEHPRAIAPLPVASLRIDAAAVTVLRRLGVETVGALAAMPRAPLARRFGGAVLARLDEAVGARPEPFDPVQPPQAATAHCRFAEPIGSAEAIGEAIAKLVADLVAELGRRGHGARRLLLACRRVDNRQVGAAIGTARPSRDAAHLLRLLLPKIETIDPGFGIEAMRLTALRTDALGAIPIPGALAGDPPAPDLAPLIDILAGRLGARRLYRMSAVESDVPERSLIRAAPLAAPRSWPPDWPRPACLLDPPERVDNVMAELPDQPPRRFSWRGRTYRVRAGDGPERIYGEWWSRAAEARAVRDYFQVEDEEGARFWLFRRGDGVDIATGDLSWHLHGVFA